MDNEDRLTKKRKYPAYLSPEDVEHIDTEAQVPAASQSDLCGKCTTLDFDKIFQLKVRKANGMFVLDLEAPPDELKGSACSLCRLFGSVSPASSGGGKESLANCHIRAFSAQKLFTGAKNLHEFDITLLGVVRIAKEEVNSGVNLAFLKIKNSWRETGLLCRVLPSRTGPHFGARLLSSGSFDFAISKESLSYCQQYHKSTCTMKIGSSMSFFRVIDCVSRTVVVAPSTCSYIALSQLWGSEGPQL